MTRSMIHWLAATWLIPLMVACGSNDTKGGSSKNTNDGAVVDPDDQESDSSTSGSSTSGTSGGFGGFQLGETGVGPSSGSSDGGCGGATNEATPKRVNVLLVVDKSGGMADRFGQPAEGETEAPTKWSVMKTALKAALESVRNDMKFGIELFPMSPAGSSPIQVDCGADCCVHRSGESAINVQIPDDADKDTVDDILTLLDETPPGGGTPTARALRTAYEYFHTPSPGSILPGDRYVLLATEGGPNCNLNKSFSCTFETCTNNMEDQVPRCPRSPDGDGRPPPNCCVAGQAGPQGCLDSENTESFITKLNEIGVKTFIVGIPGSEAYAAQLDHYAELGGTARTDGETKYYKVENPESLTTALQQITANLIQKCEFPLETIPENFNDLRVYVDGSEIKRGAADGWKLNTDDKDKPAVELTGQVCEKIKAEGAQKVQIDYGCGIRL